MASKYDYFPGMNLEERILFDILREVEIITSGGGVVNWANGYPTYDLRYAPLSSTIHGPVTNFSALPASGTVSGQYYEVLNAQGTQWVGAIYGGTYYPNGLYYSNGTDWIHSDNPYQASQATVNAGLVSDQFVSPLTLKTSPFAVPAGTPGFVAFWGATALTGSSELTYASGSGLNITQITAGNNVQSWTTITAGDDPIYKIVQDSVNTTNAAITTLHTFAIPTDQNVTLNVDVSAFRTGGSAGTVGDRGIMTGEYRVKNVAGTLTMMKNTVDNTSADQAWVISFTISTTNILLQVTGTINNNISWKLTKGQIKIGGV